MDKFKLGNRNLNSVAKQIVMHARELFVIPDDYEITIIGEKLGQYDGRCFATDCEALIEINSEIKWWQFAPPDLAAVVGHELVHVYQTLHCGLEIEEKQARYKNKLYRLRYETEYWLSPWEIEARGYEDYFRWYWTKSQARNMEKIAA
jgi:hypothetical protein